MYIGSLPTADREQKKCWMECFREILNKPPPEEDADIQEAADDLDINTAVPEKEQITKAIKSLKNGKAPGNDNFNKELFKVLAATILQTLLAAIWEGGEVPADWIKGVIITIPKKGALSNCNNWRGITLLSVPSKILAKIIIKWISDVLDTGMRKEQAGFRRQQGCTDQFFTFRNIIEQNTEWQRQ